jgi:hypothetical protein
MPINDATGKTDRRRFTERQLLDFRLSQVQGGASKKKGSYRTREEASSLIPSPSGLTPSPSGLTPSPSALLPPLGQLTLSSASSPANTAADMADVRGGSDIEIIDSPVASSQHRGTAQASKPIVSAPAHAAASTSRLPPSSGDNLRAGDGGGSTEPSYREVVERLKIVEKRMDHFERVYGKAT